MTRPGAATVKAKKNASDEQREAKGTYHKETSNWKNNFLNETKN